VRPRPFRAEPIWVVTGSDQQAGRRIDTDPRGTLVPLRHAVPAAGWKQCFEAAALLTASAGHRLEAWFHVALGTGARPGEIAALAWLDVDIDAATVRIVATKTKERVRVLRIAPTVVDALRTHRKVQTEERLLMGDRWPEQHDDLVFRSEAGTPIDAANARRLVRAIANKANIDHLTPYELRHTHASILSDDGIHAESLADRMGHRDSRTTLAYYRHQITPVVEVGAELDFSVGAG
jgi:integrase